MLVGTAGRIIEARPAANLSDDPNRFELDPQVHVRALRDTRGTALSVVGFYHSHPHSAPVPSPRDMAECTYPDAIHLIVGFVSAEQDAAETRAFRLTAIGYDEIALSVEDTPSADEHDIATRRR